MTDFRLGETLFVKFSVFLVFGFVFMVWLDDLWFTITSSSVFTWVQVTCFVIIYRIIEGDIVREVIEASSKFAYSTNKILST